VNNFAGDSAPVQRSRVLLAACLGWLTAASVHPNTITVTNINDSGPGSLRQAIADANDDDTINAKEVSGSIELSSGELLLNKNVTINGPGADTLSVENTQLKRVFEITSDKIAAITGLAINSGKASVGGGIYNAGTLQIIDCGIGGNQAVGLREPGAGGGIYNASGAEINIVDSIISGNSADEGGAIYNAGSMQIVRTTISGNVVGGSFLQPTSLGGGICNNGTLNIVNSAITNNTASVSLQSGGVGGGIFNGATLVITNSTISSNVAGSRGAFPGGGGGIASGNGNIVIQSSTIHGNTAGSASGSGLGGNILIVKGSLEIGNTILNAGSGGNIFSFGNQGKIISDGYNLSSDDGAGYLIASGDQVNTDPRLGPLQDNGGRTFTHALLVGSPAIDAGNLNYNPNNLQPQLIRDQRGVRFDRVKNGPSDIGAFEVQAPSVRPTPPPTPPPSPTPPPPTPSPTPPPSPSATATPPSPSPSPTENPRDVAIAEIRRDIRFTRTALQQLNGTTSVPPSVFTWLKIRLRVLKARLAYPLDEALAQIDRQLLNGGPMNEASRRNLLARLNDRLNALRNGG
jgi:hypothetical protein